MRTRLGIPRALDGQLWRYRLPGPVQPSHSHAELELDFVLRGDATLLVEGRRVPLVAHGMLWLPPGAAHGVVAHSDDFEMWIACFKRRVVRRLTRSPASRALRGKGPGLPACRALAENDARRLSILLAEVSAYEDSATYNAGLGYLLLHAWQAWQHTFEENAP